MKPGESLVEAIAVAVIEKLNPKPISDDKQHCNWIDDGEDLICECCFNVLNSDKTIPSHLANLRRCNFGVVKKDAQKLKRNQTVHTNSGLHVWCKTQHERVLSEKNKYFKNEFRCCRINSH